MVDLIQDALAAHERDPLDPAALDALLRAWIEQPCEVCGGTRKGVPQPWVARGPGDTVPPPEWSGDVPCGWDWKRAAFIGPRCGGTGRRFRDAHEAVATLLAAIETWWCCEGCGGTFDAQDAAHGATDGGPCGPVTAREQRPLLPAMRSLYTWWTLREAGFSEEAVRGSWDKLRAMISGTHGHELGPLPDDPSARLLDALLAAICRVPAPCSACGGMSLVSSGPSCACCRGSGREPCPFCAGTGWDAHCRAVAGVGFVAGEATACWLCYGAGAFPLLAPGICARCGRPSEMHTFERMPGWTAPGGEHLSHWTPMSHDEERFDHFYEGRPSPLASAWPRKKP